MTSDSVATKTRWLIVNADDFGLSSGVNAGIIAAHERGIVTSASLLVRWPAAAEAASYAATRGKLSVGLHVDLGEWQCREGKWEELYRVVPADDAAAVRAEVRRQLDVFHKLAGGNPTHIDSHQHYHRDDPARTVVLEIAAELGVPVRDFAPGIRYCGGFYGQSAYGHPFPDGISRAGLLQLLEDLPPGVTELGCHPGLDDELRTMYCRERRHEVDVLCDAEIATAAGRLGIRLISFAEAASLAARQPVADSGIA
jgi:chitin disaccharide deacetylase